MTPFHALLPAFFALTGCVTPTDLPAGTWEFSPNTMRFDTEIGKSTTRELLIRNNYNGYIETEFARRIHYTGAINSGMSGGPAVTIDGEVFRNVTPGSTVQFRLTVRNTIFPQRTQAQLFTIDLIVVGDGVTTLDVRTVYIIVPAMLSDIIFG